MEYPFFTLSRLTTEKSATAASDQDVDIMLRCWNAKSAQASVGLEGLTVSDSTLALTERFRS